MRPTSRLSSAVLCAFAMAAGMPSMHAALLIYEGFDGYTSGANFDGVSPNANTRGLDTGVAYGGSGTTAFTANSAGLTFGSLTTSGGSATSSATSAVVAGKLSSTFASYSGTLYSSYLVSLNTRGTGAGDGFEVRISDNTSTGGTGGNVRFRTLADSRSSSEAPGVDYVTLSTGGGTIANATGGALTIDTTFMIVGSFTNVGTAFTASNQGTAKLYAFSLAQFEFMMSQSDPTAYFNALGAANVGTAANQVSAFATENGGATGATYGLDSSDFMQFVSVNDGATVDEIRFAGDFLSVVPVPEPASAVLGGLGLLGLLARRRR